jgi:hypothetical protein
MNITSLEDFKKEVNQIREYLKHIQYVSDVVGCALLEKDNEQLKVLLNRLKEHDRLFRTDRGLFEYKAAIISLYGLLKNMLKLGLRNILIHFPV